MKKLFLPIFVLFFVPKFVFAFPYLELPFPGGETWWVSCAYDGVGECDTHAENTKDRYALDFNFGVGNEDCGKIILASASGKVSISNFDGYGNTVDINHKNDYITRYAHLSDFFVKDGQRVLRGQKIGYCGSTGGDWPCHLHFVLYRMQNGFYVPVKPEPMSGYTNFKSGVYYKSDNYYNPTHFTFPSGSSQGMTPNYSMTEVPLSGDYNEWRVQVDGSDPGVDSPSYPAGLLGKHVIIEFSAKVVDGGHPLLEGKVFVEDENGSWNNHVPLDLINDEHNYNEGDFAHGDYNVYRANLSELDRPEAEMRKFSLQLTEGFS